MGRVRPTSHVCSAKQIRAIGTAVGILDQSYPMLLVLDPCGTAGGFCDLGHP